MNVLIRILSGRTAQSPRVQQPDSSDKPLGEAAAASSKGFSRAGASGSKLRVLPGGGVRKETGQSGFYKGPLTISDPADFHKLRGNVFPRQRDVRMPRPDSVCSEDSVCEAPWTSYSVVEKNFRKEFLFELDYRKLAADPAEEQTGIPPADNTESVQPYEEATEEEQADIPPVDNTKFVQLDEKATEEEQADIPPVDNTKFVQLDEEAIPEEKEVIPDLSALEQEPEQEQEGWLA